MQNITDQLAQAKNTGNTTNNENDITEKENHERLISLAAIRKDIEILENALKPLKYIGLKFFQLSAFITVVSVLLETCPHISRKVLRVALLSTKLIMI